MDEPGTIKQATRYTLDELADARKSLVATLYARQQLIPGAVKGFGVAAMPAGILGLMRLAANKPLIASNATGRFVGVPAEDSAASELPNVDRSLSYFGKRAGVLSKVEQGVGSLFGGLLSKLPFQSFAQNPEDLWYANQVGAAAPLVGGAGAVLAARSLLNRQRQATRAKQMDSARRVYESALNEGVKQSELGRELDLLHAELEAVAASRVKQSLWSELYRGGTNDVTGTVNKFFGLWLPLAIAGYGLHNTFRTQPERKKLLEGVMLRRESGGAQTAPYYAYNDPSRSKVPAAGQ